MPSEVIALDVMGGDKAPDEIGKGAIAASLDLGAHIALVGPKEVLAFQMERAREAGAATITPVEASQVVEMAESPTEAWRKKPDSSIAVGLRLHKEGKAAAFISAGNTGAIGTAALFTLGTMPGIERPAIATIFSTTDGKAAIFLDIGANADCRPSFLLQFAQMGSDFMTKLFQVERPRVGLLSNGEEESKGSKLVKESHALLKASNLNFIGNVEGFDVLNGKADVVVTDGFTGNVVLKLAEALTESIFLSLKDALINSPLARASKFLWGPPIKSVVKQWDYSNIGGAPLLGVNGNVIMAHGRSDADDVKHAIEFSLRMIREGWLQPSGMNPKTQVSHQS